MFRKTVAGKAGSFLGPQCFISFSFFKLGDSKHDTDFEPVFRTRFYKPGGVCGRTECSKVAVTWQWANHLQATVPPGRRLLFMNLDETYVQYYQGLFKGNLAVTKKQWPVTQRPLSQPASRNQLRMGLTHVGLICDEPLVQPLLPQVLIASDSVLTMIVWRAILPLLPNWMYVIRMPSKWITADCLVWIINLIGWSLRAVAHLYDIVLSMDVLGLHYVAKVIAAARANRIRLHFIPGKLTWLLQPLDTHGFSLYKRYLNK